MRSFSVAVAFVLSLASWNVAYSQNGLRPGGQQPAGGQGRPAAGGEEAPAPRAGFAPAAAAGQPVAAANDPAYMQQVSYALGRTFASQLKSNDIQPEMQSLMAGISDTLSGAQPKWSDQQLDTVLERFQREMQQKAMMRMQQEAAKNKQEEATFLTQNSKREGVQTTPTGLQYRVLAQGQGATPTLNDTVKCNYRGTLLNGTEFDSTAKAGEPATFPVKRVIPGWTEALQKMKVGDKWQLFIPSKLAYGMDPPPGSPIEAGSMLVFEIELLDVAKGAPAGPGGPGAQF